MSLEIHSHSQNCTRDCYFDILLTLFSNNQPTVAWMQFFKFLKILKYPSWCIIKYKFSIWWNIYSGCHLTICKEFFDFFCVYLRLFLRESLHSQKIREGLGVWHICFEREWVFIRHNCMTAKACISNFFHSISKGKGFHYWRKNQNRSLSCKFV